MSVSALSIEVLLDYVKRTRGFDFSGYKRASLERRIAKRLELVGVEGYEDYVDYLEVNQDEFSELFNTILINVTGFFRDAPAWDYLASESLPRLFEHIDDDQPIRVWCAGCSSGEEAYTLAIVLAEALGENQYMERVKIYATDVDEEALNEARQATYPVKAIKSIPPELVERYFERFERQVAFRKDLRRTVIFGRNDLVQNAPISRIDLLTCRNTLMYFSSETQARILNRFHFALNPWGYLFLGRSEMLITHADLFRPVSLDRRVFSKVIKPSLRERLATVAHGQNRRNAGDHAEVIRDSAFDAAPVAQVVVDADGVIEMANALARSVLGLTLDDVGRPLKDLQLSYRPVELRSQLELAHTERRTVTVPSVTAALPTGEMRDLEVHITPLAAGNEVLGAVIAYYDVTRQQRLHEELETSKRELESLYEELQSTVEELETTNEELQSTNEELETTNEELQSSNEELETMNEELQSTNEELETINDELRQRTVELDEVNAFLETILTSMGLAVMVVDRNHTVQVWSAHSTELWGLREEEAEGRHLFGLDIGMPLDGLRAALREVLTGRTERSQLVAEATNRRGRDISVHVSCVPLAAGGDGQVSGAIVLMEETAARRDGA